MDFSAFSKAKKISLMIFDVDGVLTDGCLHIGAEGEVFKTFHALDGHGIKLLQQSGIKTAIISARTSAIVSRRAEELGICHVQQGAHNKRVAFEHLLNKTGLTAQDCGFMGDDVIDLPILLRAGFSASVQGGHPDVLSRVDYVTHALGGKGAVREVCDGILRIQDKYEAALAPYLA